LAHDDSCVSSRLTMTRALLFSARGVVRFYACFYPSCRARCLRRGGPAKPAGRSVCPPAIQGGRVPTTASLSFPVSW